MHKHLSTFLFITIGSFSFIAIAMDKAEPISTREFRNPLARNLTKEEEKTKSELYGLLTEKLAAQFAAARGISATKKTAPEPIIVEPSQEEDSAQVLYTPNIFPSDIDAALKGINEKCKNKLLEQIQLASQVTEIQNAVIQADAQEETKKALVESASHKKVYGPSIMKNLAKSTFEATQVAQAPSASASSVSYNDLDALLASVDTVPTKRISSSIPSVELDQLLADLESYSPQSVNPLYEDPSAADLGPIQQVERVSLKNSAADITSKIQELHKLFNRVAKTAEQFGNKIPNIPDEFSYDLQDLDKISDELAPVLSMKSENENIPALNRLKDLVASVSETDLVLENPALKRNVAYKSYAASLKSLNATLALAK